MSLLARGNHYSEWGSCLQRGSKAIREQESSNSLVSLCMLHEQGHMCESLVSFEAQSDRRWGRAMVKLWAMGLRKTIWEVKTASHKGGRYVSFGGWEHCRKESQTSPCTGVRSKAGSKEPAVPVALTCKPSYSGGRDQKDRGSKPAQANSLRDPISKKGWWSGTRCRTWLQTPVPQKGSGGQGSSTMKLKTKPCLQGKRRPSTREVLLLCWTSCVHTCIHRSVLNPKPVFS
jgi:hypothetical protein